MATMDAPSAERNKEPIWLAFQDFVLQSSLTARQSSYCVLEIAAGAGVHTIYLGQKMEQFVSSSRDLQHIAIEWIPTDPDQACRNSIQQRTLDAYSQQIISDHVHIHQPLSLTLHQAGILEESILQDLHAVDCILCVNMIHIAPWDATTGLMKFSSSILRSSGGLLCLYGPFLDNGTAVESNLAFDAALKARNSSWGVRNLQDVELVASNHGLVLRNVINMPANNLFLIFEKKHVAFLFNN